MAVHPRSASSGNNVPSAPTSVRIDVRLRSVRQIKSRSATTSVCKAGHVRINGETAKPVQHVPVGDEVRYRIDGSDRLLIVTRTLTKRVGALIVRIVYIDSSPLLPSPLNVSAVVIRDRGVGRSTKKERRQFDALTGGGRYQDGRV